jgi:hydroxymethylpyrimidine/phosphomethylpyrimidine kinase
LIHGVADALDIRYAKSFKHPRTDPSWMNGAEMNCACTIAGSDSGGGAGIQADLKVFTAHGVWGVTVITAVTAQNPGGVKGSWVLPPEAVTAQMEAVFSHFPVRAIKTGMLGSAGNIRAILRRIPRDVLLIVDPVMVATSGARLITDEATQILVRDLLPRSTLVTPNIPEAEVITGSGPIRTVEDMCGAAELIRSMGPQVVLIKGGHLPSTSQFITDVLVDSEGQWLIEGPRYPYKVHGSGCTLSAAITGGLANGLPLREAVHQGRTFTLAALKGAYISAGGLRSSNPH